MAVSVYALGISDKESSGQSDEKAFECLFKSYYVKLSFFANKFVCDLEAAEEIVSDSFAHLWEERENYKINSSESAYLYRMVQNRCLNYLKHKKIESEYVNYLAKNNRLTEIPEAGRNPFLQKELEEQVKKAISELPEKCREVFMLSRFDQLKNREIASHLNISPKTVERHITLAIEKLRNGLKHLFLVLFLPLFF